MTGVRGITLAAAVPGAATATATGAAVETGILIGATGAAVAALEAAALPGVAICRSVLNDTEEGTVFAATVTCMVESEFPK